MPLNYLTKYVHISNLLEFYQNNLKYFTLGYFDRIQGDRLVMLLAKNGQIRRRSTQ